ncbi:MAG: copper chaperone PCu(A)C [Solirubrobacterales bacterium]|nr:copper chaperone PCu(A)C [Solirubrobacterales bacterium]MCB0860520.1 copper chaperone PCu(A)C [Solirubrobacterales bacterium]HRV59099.1 copper chaperone PCu(A)C [Solirubrobacterales bacterium]
MKKLVPLATVVLALGIFVAACGSDDSDSGSSGVEVTDVWARPTTPTADAGAIYMTINSKDGDSLTAAKVPSSIAGMTQIHETTTDGEATSSEDSMESGDSMSSDDSMGSDDSMDSDHSMEGGSMMGMKEVSQIDIPAGETVTLEPGGFHIMLLDLKGQIKAGDTIPVTLTFEKAGTVEVDATAQDQ